jgi:hypothetical protein
VAKKEKKTSEEKKKKWKRNKVQYPALNPRFNPKIRHESIDADYLDKLSEEELAWYNKFMEEENNASFKKDGTDLNDTDKERKRIYAKNNARQRCIYSRAKASSRVHDVLNNDTQQVNDLYQKESKITEDEFEDMLIEYIDVKKKLKPSK